MFSSNDISFTLSNATCYQILRCESAICLDWRDICNGVWECLNGEDDANCIEIDTHGCEDQEYRCRNGMCIDRNFLFDGFYDCADQSDEQEPTLGYSAECYAKSSLQCEQINCAWNQFSCGNGVCVSSPMHCISARKNLYLSYLFANPHKEDLNGTLCWQIMICSMVAVFGDFASASSKDCRRICQNYDIDCFRLRQDICPKYYYFPSKFTTHRFSVYFVYDTTVRNLQLKEMILPTFVCFDNHPCLLSEYGCENVFIINDHMCDHYTEHWTNDQFYPWNGKPTTIKRSNYLEFITNWCRYDRMFSLLNCTEKLYKCRYENRCISKYWVNNGENDCSRGDDENSINISASNLINLFKCKRPFSITEWVHRKYLMDWKARCIDSNHELHPLICNQSQSLGCRYLRNNVSSIPYEYFMFQELCNGIIRRIDRANKNETDEDDCQEWQTTCKNRAMPCANQRKWQSCIPKVWNCHRLFPNKFLLFSFDGFNQQSFISRSYRNIASFNLPRLSANLLPDKNNYILSNYVLFYCNQGILITTRDGTDRCLCPPNYYGRSCQYQNHRVLLIISIDIFEIYQNIPLVLRLAVSLVSQDDDQPFSVEQITHIFPIHTLIWRHLMYLRYPNKLNSSLFYVRIDVFLASSQSISFHSSWYYEIPFQHILPVNRIRAHLQITRIRNNTMCSSCIYGKCIIYENFIEKFYCLCEEGWYGKRCEFKQVEVITSCGKGAQRLFTNMCICPLFTFGNQCYIRLDSKYIACENNGIIIRDSSPPLCLCPKGFHGLFCEHRDANLLIKVSENEHIKETVPIVAIHLLDLDCGVSVTKVKLRVIFSNIKLSSSSLPTIFLYGESYLPPFIFIQFYFNTSNAASDFYLIGLLKDPTNTLFIDTFMGNRCPHVNTLLNHTIINEYSRLKRYKFYFKICLNQSSKCFFDEKYLCLCDNLRRFECLWFDHQASNCTEKGYCQNGGHCVESTPTLEKDLIKFACLCTSCIFGDLCQFTTAHYSISLDVLVGMNGAKDKTIMSYIVFGIVLFFFCIGLISNLISFITLCHSSCQETGCGFYILCLTIVGQLGLIVFTLKLIFLLMPSSNYNFNLWSCRIIESALSFIPPLFDWLTACIAMERTFMIIQDFRFNKARSKIIARYIAFPTTIFLTFGSTFHRVLYRRVINDFRSNQPIWWCIVELQEYKIKIYDITVNIVHLVIPVSINLVTMFYFLFAKTRREKRLLISSHAKQINYCTIFHKQIKIYASFVVGPIVLGLLQTPRLILSLAFVCTQAPWQIYFYVISYIISCLPLMAGTLLFYIIPSPVYRKNMKNVLNKFRCIR